MSQVVDEYSAALSQVAYDLFKQTLTDTPKDVLGIYAMFLTRWREYSLKSEAEGKSAVEIARQAGFEMREG